MRNQWPCVVESVERLGPIARVHLQAAEPGAVALSLASRITARKRRAAGPAAWAGLVGTVQGHGGAGDAVCQSPAAGVNWWEGRVTRLSRGPEVDEVAAQLDAGVQMVGFAPTGSGLRVPVPGQAAGG